MKNYITDEIKKISGIFKLLKEILINYLNEKNSW